MILEKTGNMYFNNSIPNPQQMLQYWVSAWDAETQIIWYKYSVF